MLNLVLGRLIAARHCRGTAPARSDCKTFPLARPVLGRILPNLKGSKMKKLYALMFAAAICPFAVGCSDAAKKQEDAAHRATEEMKAAVEAAKKATDEAAEKTKAAVEDATAKAKEAVEGATQAAEDAAASAKKAAEDAAAKAKEAVESPK